MFGFATRTTTDKQEDLLKKIKSFIGKKLSTNDIQRNNSLDRRIKKPNGEQERDLLNEHEVNKILFP